MNPREPISKRIPRIYEQAKQWIVYVDIVFLLIILYFGDILGPWREKLFATAALGLLAILFEILICISDGLKIKPEARFFQEIADALPKIRQIVSHDRQVTFVKVIAVTGGLTVKTLLPQIKLHSSARKIEISMGILDPANHSHYREWIPHFWPDECKLTIERLKTETIDGRTSVNLRLFKNLPVPHGLLINDKHLFLAFFTWEESDEKSQLKGRQLPHHYYEVGKPGFSYYLNLFEAWFERTPSESFSLTSPTNCKYASASLKE